MFKLGSSQLKQTLSCDKTLFLHWLLQQKQTMPWVPVLIRHLLIRVTNQFKYRNYQKTHRIAEVQASFQEWRQNLLMSWILQEEWTHLELAPSSVTMSVLWTLQLGKGKNDRYRSREPCLAILSFHRVYLVRVREVSQILQILKNQSKMKSIMFHKEKA